MEDRGTNRRGQGGSGNCFSGPLSTRSQRLMAVSVYEIATLRSCLDVFIKVNRYPPYDLSAPLLGIHLEEIKTCHEKIARMKSVTGHL